MSNIKSSLQNKKILITGATSGIGKAIAELLLAQGCYVLGVGRNFSKVNFNSPLFTPIHLELDDLENLPSHLKKIHKEHPVLDALILNAGTGRFGHLEEFSFEQIEQLIAINFTSHTFLAKTWLPSMKKEKRGHILFMGSEAALQGKKEGTLYCATKFALRGFFQALKDECRDVRMTLINPGMVDTPFFDKLKFRPQEGASISPKDLAGLVVQTLLNPLHVDEINLSPQKTGIVKSPQKLSCT